MTLEQLALWTQIVGGVGVIVSLLFVVRQAIAQNRDVAELMTHGLDGTQPLDAADQPRLEQMLAETA